MAGSADVSARTAARQVGDETARVRARRGASPAVADGLDACLQALFELQERVASTQRDLSAVLAQIEAHQKEMQRNAIVEQHVAHLPDAAVVYKAVGRMYAARITRHAAFPRPSHAWRPRRFLRCEPRALGAELVDQGKRMSTELHQLKVRLRNGARHAARAHRTADAPARRAQKKKIYLEKQLRERETQLSEMLAQIGLRPRAR